MLIAEPAEFRDKYSGKDRDAMADSGQAMPDGSYPIKDAEDLQNAMHAVGRGNADHDAIRKHIIARADALGLSKDIPDNWNADGSLKAQSNSRVRRPRHRDIPAARALASALLPEVRHFTAHSLEIRSAADGANEIVITGTPIVYNAPYEVRDQFGLFAETMLPGVANGLLDTADIRFLFNHEGMPMARSTNGTLVFEDRAGQLDFTARLDARSHAHNDLAIAIERGDISQMSVGFSVAAGGDHWNEAGDQRSISQFNSFLDVSAVTYPASPTTNIEIAKRMLAQAPAESAVRLFNMATEIRAGKVLSTSNQQLLVDAVAAMHRVLDASGFDPSQLIEAADDDIYDADTPEAPEVQDAVDDITHFEDEPQTRSSLALAEAELTLLKRRRH
jgi:hypothetical protein